MLVHRAVPRGDTHPHHGQSGHRHDGGQQEGEDRPHFTLRTSTFRVVAGPSRPATPRQGLHIELFTITTITTPYHRLPFIPIRLAAYSPAAVSGSGTRALTNNTHN